jgi:hypothetical protein
VTRRFSARIVPLIAAALITSSADGAPSASDKATAQTLFDDALKLLATKDYEPACKKLEESNRLDPAMGTKYRLGECYEHLGRTASAWATFREVADEAKAVGQNDRERRARERASKLEPKLAKLTISAAAKGVEVKRDGTVIGEGQLGTAVPIDPGSHKIEAAAPGKQPWSSTVTVAPAGNETVTIPALEDAKADKPEPPPKTETESSNTWQKPVSIAALSVGVVSLGVSTALILSARSAMKDSEPHCVGNACSAEGAQFRDTAVSRGNVSTAFFIIGLVGVAGGTVLYLTAPSDTAPRVGVGPGFVSLEGRF